MVELEVRVRSGRTWGDCRYIYQFTLLPFHHLFIAIISHHYERLPTLSVDLLISFIFVMCWSQLIQFLYPLLLFLLYEKDT